MKRRIFSAIDLSDAARRAAADHIENMKAQYPDSSARWERTEKLHITVKFAGSLDENGLGDFTEKVKVAANAIVPFQIKISGTGTFIKRRGPSVLWLGVEQLTEDDPMGKIAAMLGHKGRPFHPHVTVARIKDPKKARRLIEGYRSAHFESNEFVVKEIVVYESTLLPAGSVYTRVAGFGLSGSPK